MSSRISGYVNFSKNIIMKQQDYRSSIVTNTTPEEAFAKINDVKGWWAKNFKGSTKNTGDVFTVRFGNTYVTFKVVVSIPYSTIEWLVTDCYLHWIGDKTEWMGTKVRFDLVPDGKDTRVTMTHIGLVPGIECYEDCRQGWDEHFKESLSQLLTEQVGMPV